MRLYLLLYQRRHLLDFQERHVKVSRGYLSQNAGMVNAHNLYGLGAKAVLVDFYVAVGFDKDLNGISTSMPTLENAL